MNGLKNFKSFLNLFFRLLVEKRALESLILDIQL